MSYVFAALVLLLFANAFMAFWVAFYWQAKVILTVLKVSNWDGALVPWKALENPNSPQSNLRRFIAGDIFPRLRRKWRKAVGYVVVSYLALFLLVGVLMFFAPEYLP